MDIRKNTNVDSIKGVSAGVEGRLLLLPVVRRRVVDYADAGGDPAASDIELHLPILHITHAQLVLPESVLNPVMRNSHGGDFRHVEQEFVAV